MRAFAICLVILGTSSFLAHDSLFVQGTSAETLMWAKAAQIIMVCVGSAIVLLKKDREIGRVNRLIIKELSSEKVVFGHYNRRRSAPNER